MTTSTPKGRSSMLETHGRPLTSGTLRLTSEIVPGKLYRSRFAKAAAPIEPGEIPTIATDSGRSKRVMRETLIACGSAGSLFTPVGLESGPVGLRVKKLLERLFATAMRVLRARLFGLRGQVIFRGVP